MTCCISLQRMQDAVRCYLTPTRWASRRFRLSPDPNIVEKNHSYLSTRPKESLDSRSTSLPSFPTRPLSRHGQCTTTNRSAPQRRSGLHLTHYLKNTLPFRKIRHIMPSPQLPAHLPAHHTESQPIMMSERKPQCLTPGTFHPDLPAFKFPMLSHQPSTREEWKMSPQ